MNGQQGLYRSEYEHDACGVGLVADLNGTPSHAIVAAAASDSRNWRVFRRD